jgi:hypothetical protein
LRNEPNVRPQSGLYQAANYTMKATFTAAFSLFFNAFQEKSGYRPDASVSSRITAGFQAEK